MLKMGKNIAIIIVFCLLATKPQFATASSEDHSQLESNFLTELSQNAPLLSSDQAGEIDILINEIEEIATSINKYDVSTDNRTLFTSNNSFTSKQIEYEIKKKRAEELGCIFLDEEQAYQYIYGKSLPKLKTASISYPEIKGINFIIYYYVYKGEKLAKCSATHKPDISSKLVKNYRPVVMTENLSYKALLKKGVEMSATKLLNYTLGKLVNGKVKFLINTLASAAGSIFPSNSYTSDAQLTLTVSTTSHVVHIWRYMNDNYYLRTSTVMADIVETWTLSDVNGKQHIFTLSYKSLSPHFSDNDYAIEVASPQSFGIYQAYRVQGFLGFKKLKLEVSPFTAAFPIDFAD